MTSLSPTWRGQTQNARRLLDYIEEHAEKLERVAETTAPEDLEWRRRSLEEQIAGALEDAAKAIVVAQAKWWQR